eukprot:13436564-Alexandrium_andersonii.AAC.1
MWEIRCAGLVALHDPPRELEPGEVLRAALQGLRPAAGDGRRRAHVRRVAAAHAGPRGAGRHGKGEVHLGGDGQGVRRDGRGRAVIQLKTLALRVHQLVH